ncbi:MAG: hypothetical protein LBI04_08665 [Treponema sp.]|jgi:hypothetical protein|nr:hypothetical protein [Treponema sp.]
MKFKTLLLVILLLPLLMRISYAQTQTISPDMQNNGFGIELEQFYPGSLVLELLEAAETEIDEVVYEAFNEGYKAATLRYAPELAALKIRESALLTELERERKLNRFFMPAVGLSFAGGLLLHSFISR